MCIQRQQEHASFPVVQLLSPPREVGCDVLWWVCLSVWLFVCLFVCHCLSACLSARITRTSSNCLCMLPVAAARSSDGIAICYVLPVLRVTLCFHIMGPQSWMKHNVMFRRVRQVAVPVGHETTTVFVYLRYRQNSALEAKSDLYGCLVCVLYFVCCPRHVMWRAVLV